MAAVPREALSYGSRWTSVLELGTTASMDREALAAVSGLVGKEDNVLAREHWAVLWLRPSKSDTMRNFCPLLWTLGKLCVLTWDLGSFNLPELLWKEKREENFMQRALWPFLDTEHPSCFYFSSWESVIQTQVSCETVRQERMGGWESIQTIPGPGTPLPCPAEIGVTDEQTFASI